MIGIIWYQNQLYSSERKVKEWYRKRVSLFGELFESHLGLFILFYFIFLKPKNEVEFEVEILDKFWHSWQILTFLTNFDADCTWLTFHGILLTWCQQIHHNTQLKNQNLINSNNQKTKAPPPFPRSFPTHFPFWNIKQQVVDVGNSFLSPNLFAVSDI